MSSRPSAYQLTSPGPLRLYSTTELLTLPPPEFLVEPIVQVGGFSGLYSPSNLGKTFVAIDVAMSVASGLSWQGHATMEGYVIYVSAEGGSGIGKRARAWLQYHDVAARDAQIAWIIEPLLVYPESEQLDRLLERIAEIDRRPSLVVLDTLNRCFDGNENETEDMTAFVRGCDILRHQLETAVLVVHHTRLDGDRERGNTAFKGAADTMIALKAGEMHLTLECAKQKEWEAFPAIDFRLDKVLMADEQDIALDSCVPVLLNRQGRPQKVTDDQLLAPLRSGPLNAEEWRRLVQPEVSHRTFYRRIRDLYDTSLNHCEDGTYSLKHGRA